MVFWCLYNDFFINDNFIVEVKYTEYYIWGVIHHHETEKYGFLILKVIFYVVKTICIFLLENEIIWNLYKILNFLGKK